MLTGVFIDGSEVRSEDIAKLIRLTSKTNPIAVPSELVSVDYGELDSKVKKNSENFRTRTELVLKVLNEIHTDPRSAHSLEGLISESVNFVMNATDANPPAPIDILLASKAVFDGNKLTPASIAEIKKISVATTSSARSGGLYENSGINLPASEVVNVYLIKDSSGKIYYSPFLPTRSGDKVISTDKAVKSDVYNIRLEDEQPTNRIVNGEGTVTYTTSYNLNASIANWDTVTTTVTQSETESSSDTESEQIGKTSTTSKTTGGSREISAGVKGGGFEVSLKTSSNYSNTESTSNSEIETVSQTTGQSLTIGQSESKEVRVIETGSKGTTVSQSSTVNLRNGHSEHVVFAPVQELIIIEGSRTGTTVRLVGQPESTVVVHNDSQSDTVDEQRLGGSHGDAEIVNGRRYVRSGPGNLSYGKYPDGFVTEQELAEKINSWTNKMQAGGTYEKSVDTAFYLDSIPEVRKKLSVNQEEQQDNKNLPPYLSYNDLEKFKPEPSDRMSLLIYSFFLNKINRSSVGVSYFDSEEGKYGWKFDSTVIDRVTGHAYPITFYEDGSAKGLQMTLDPKS